MEKLRLGRLEPEMLDKTAGQVPNGLEIHTPDKFEEITINHRELARVHRIGHIALTNNITRNKSTNSTNSSSQTNNPGSASHPNSTGSASQTNGTNNASQDATSPQVGVGAHKTALPREFLGAIADNALCMKRIVNSIDIVFFIKIANVIREEITTENFPYFIADLYVLLISWEKENFNPALIADHYELWLRSLWKKYL